MYVLVPFLDNFIDLGFVGLRLKKLEDGVVENLVVIIVGSEVPISDVTCVMTLRAV
jgi:hypothetical protein